MTGRPSSFTPEIANEICERIAQGQALRTICLDDHLPAEGTVYRWLDGKEDWAISFREQYAHAREAQGDRKFEDAWDIASKATPENVQVARLQVDTIKWQASKLAPKKYGDRIAHVGGGEGEAPIAVENVTDRDRAKAMAALVAKQRQK